MPQGVRLAKFERGANSLVNFFLHLSSVVFLQIQPLRMTSSGSKTTHQWQLTLQRIRWVLPQRSVRTNSMESGWYLGTQTIEGLAAGSCCQWLGTLSPTQLLVWPTNERTAALRGAAIACLESGNMRYVQEPPPGHVIPRKLHLPSLLVAHVVAHFVEEFGSTSTTIICHLICLDLRIS